MAVARSLCSWLLSILFMFTIQQQPLAEDHKVANLTDKSWKKEEYPNPRHDVHLCGRKGQISHICDPGNILTYEEADRLDDIIEEVRTNTTCICPGCTNSSYGFTISIALMKDIYSDNPDLTNLEKLKLTERFGRYLLQKSWKFGSCEDDAVIVVSLNYKKAWTSAGNTFTSKVSDWCINHIYKQIKPSLWAGNYTQALSEMIIKYKNVINGQMPCEEGIRAGTIIFSLAMISFGMCAVISFISFFRQRFRICQCEQRPATV